MSNDIRSKGWEVLRFSLSLEIVPETLKNAMEEAISSGTKNCLEQLENENILVSIPKTFLFIVKTNFPFS